MFWPIGDKTISFGYDRTLLLAIVAHYFLFSLLFIRTVVFLDLHLSLVFLFNDNCLAPLLFAIDIKYLNWYFVSFLKNLITLWRLALVVIWLLCSQQTWTRLVHIGTFMSSVMLYLSICIMNSIQCVLSWYLLLAAMKTSLGLLLKLR